MSWQDRLREAALTSPSSVRLTFEYENVTRSFDKKTAAFNFPDADGTYIQQSGNTGRKYPLRVMFWGDDYDIEAEAFDKILHETGIFKLDHPEYGVKDVVPFGPIRQRDDLKTQSNQAIIELTFWETTGFAYPVVKDDPASEVLKSVDDYNDAAATEYEDTTDLEDVADQAVTKNTYQTLLGNVKSGLQSVADAQADVQKQFDAVNDSINNGIDILITEPLTLAYQTTIMIQAPARALTNIEARLSAYGNLLNLVTGGDPKNSNDFHTGDLYASTYVTGSIVSVVNNQFVTKTEALEAAENIIDQLNDVVIWRDANYALLGETDTGGSYQALQNAVALAAGFLVEISFSLKQERQIILGSPRSVIDLAAELYGETFESQLDFFITSNDLSRSEILEIPRGRTIVFYV